MNDKDEFNKELYNFNWKQDYPDYQEIIDREMNALLELSGYKEANELIARIKAKC